MSIEYNPPSDVDPNTDWGFFVIADSLSIRPVKPDAAKKNNPAKAGKPASRRVRFGEFGRYGVVAVHTRGSKVQWFVYDADVPDPVTGLASIIRQDDDFDRAIAGLF